MTVDSDAAACAAVDRAAVDGAASAAVEPARALAQPPAADLEAEESVIGAMLVGGAPVVERVLAEEGLTPADFYWVERHGTVFGAILDLYGRGEPVDAITVADELDRAGKLSEIVTRASVRELAALVPTSANAGHYAAIVRRKATQRAVDCELAPVVDGARNGGLPADVRERLERSLARVLETGAASAAAEEIRIVPAEAFAAKDELVEQALIGDAQKRILTENSDTVGYGDAGAGKTTLFTDMAVHLAAGEDWLGFHVPRPVTVMLIENEGPRHEFRLKLRKKLAAWTGASVTGRLFVYEAPWGRVDLRDRALVEKLARAIAERGVEVCVAGPIRRLGLEGGGTPAETVAFMALAGRVRELVGKPLAWVLVHHENKAGEISGAFLAEFDTAIHVQADGRDRTKLTFSKSRWSSRIHRGRMTLAWLPDSEGFQVAETDIDGPRGSAEKAAAHATALEWITDYVRDHYQQHRAGVPRGKVEDAYIEAHGKGRNLARTVIKRQIDAFHTGLSTAPGAETTGEPPYTLATCPGEQPNGIYLIPLEQAPSPLATTLTGDPGEHTPHPTVEGEARQLAAAPKGGEPERRASPGGGE